MMPMGAMPGMQTQPMGGPMMGTSPRGPAPGPGQRKPFRSISQVLDTPVTPELLAALPAPVQESNLMMGSKMQQTAEIPADREMVNTAMASLRDEVTLLVAAEQQNIVDLFRSLISQLPMRMKLKTAVGKKSLLEELDKAAKEIVEGSGRQMDLILLDPEVLKKDGQLVSTLHSKYSVPIVLFSSTPEAVHSQLVDDWMQGPGNGDVDQTQLAARMLKWNAKSNGRPEPVLAHPSSAPLAPPPQVQPPPATSGVMMGMQNAGGGMMGMQNAGGGMMGMQNTGGMPGMPNGGGGMMGMQQQPGPGAGGMPMSMPTSAPTNGISSSFAPLVAMLKEEIKELRKELDSKRQLEAVPKDPAQITSAMFKSQDGQGLARNLIDEMARLKKQKQEAQAAVAAAASKARLEAEAKAAQEKRRAQEEAARKLDQEEKERAKERKRQEEEAVRRQKEALEAARAALTPSERRMNAYKLASHSVVVDLDS